MNKMTAVINTYHRSIEARYGLGGFISLQRKRLVAVRLAWRAVVLKFCLLIYATATMAYAAAIEFCIL